MKSTWEDHQFNILLKVFMEAKNEYSPTRSEMYLMVRVGNDTPGSIEGVAASTTSKLKLYYCSTE